MNIIGVFPTPVGIVDLPRSPTETELNFMKVQTVVNNEGNFTSTNNYILNTPELSDLKYLIWAQVQHFFNVVYQPKYFNNLRITQSWVNYNPPNGFHHTHAHPNSILSGVFYAQGNESEGKITFHKTDYQQLYFSPSNENDFNFKSKTITATTNKLVIFPSGLTHSVEPFKSASTRISLSFNTFATGILGENTSLTELIL